jgi:hypothetical protein
MWRKRCTGHYIRTGRGCNLTAAAYRDEGNGNDNGLFLTQITTDKG